MNTGQVDRQARRGVSRYSCEELERRQFLTGVTLITHGYTFGTSDDEAGVIAEPEWVNGMQHQIGDRLTQSGRDVSYADLVVKPSGNGLTTIVRSFGGPTASTSNSGELVVTVDWTQANGMWRYPYYKTATVAGALVEALTSPAFLPEFGLGSALAALPIHLIGHSRGGSLVASLARQLGQHGIWVDHLTMLDPTPVWDDEKPVLTRNVVYADEVWQSGNVAVFFPTTGPVPGAITRKITSSSLGYAGTEWEATHSDTHLWYAATIDNEGDVFDGEVTFASDSRASWFKESENLGRSVGYALSRIAGGELERSGLGKGFGHDGYGDRSEADLSGEQWPNVGNIRPFDGWSVKAGASIDVGFDHESSEKPNDIWFFLDIDTNPFNGNELRPIANFAAPGLTDHSFEEWFTWNVEAYPPGSYYIGAVASAGARSRVAYSAKPVSVSDPGVPGPHQLVNGTSAPVSVATGGGGQILVGLTNTQNAPVVVTHSPVTGEWSAVNLAKILGLGKTVGATATWVNPKDGLRYAAATVADKLQVFRASATGSWSSVDMTALAGIASPIVSDLQSMIGPDGRVHLVGLNPDRELVRYFQADDGSWKFENIATLHLVPRGQTVPAFDPGSQLVSYATTWGGLNVAGIDLSGNVWSVWWAPGQANWQSSNLTAITGLSPVVGGLAVYLTSWNGINIAGVDSEGRTRVAWWVPSFGGDWKQADLTQIAAGPTFEPGSISSYVSSWGGLNIAGRNKITGDVEVYWWSPERVGQSSEWQVAQLSQLVTGTPKLTSLRGLAGDDQSLNVFGLTDTGRVERLTWKPGGQWGLENVSQVAKWA